MDKKLEKDFANMVANLLQTEFCKGFNPALLHGFMGIASEASEILNKYQNSCEFTESSESIEFDRIDTLVELSDLLHYVQMIVGTLGSSITEVLELNLHIPNTYWDGTVEEQVSGSLREFMRLSSGSGELLNRYKKFMFYHGEPFGREEILAKLFILLYHMQVVLDILDSSFEEIILVNLAKLNVRYPNGYSHDKAITHHRDKKGERVAIENALRRRMTKKKEVDEI